MTEQGRALRVLLLSWEYPPVMVGGLGSHVHALSKALVRAGHGVTVLTRHTEGAAIEEHVDGVRVVRVPEDPPLVELTDHTLLTWAMAYNHALTRAGLRAAHTAGFDVIHAHDWMVGHSAITLKQELGLPLVTTIHATEAGRHQGWLPTEPNRSIHSVECWLANESERVVVCSHYMRWEVNRLLRVPCRRVEVIANGVEPLRWRADPGQVRAARLRYSGAGPLVGFAGRLVYEKGVQDLVHALPGLRHAHPGLRLIIAGDGPYRHTLRTEVERLDLQQAVSFTGYLGAELPAVMAATDTMVVPSIYEPFGMIALEAAAAGSPVAAAATGGLKEIIEPGRTGMTFTAGDPAALVRSVSRLLGDAGAARRMARTANHMVVDRYSWDTIAQRTVRVYDRAVAHAAGGVAPATACRPKIVVPDGNLLGSDAA